MRRGMQPGPRLTWFSSLLLSSRAPQVKRARLIFPPVPPFLWNLPLRHIRVTPGPPRFLMLSFPWVDKNPMNPFPPFLLFLPFSRTLTKPGPDEEPFFFDHNRTPAPYSTFLTTLKQLCFPQYFPPFFFSLPQPVALRRYCKEFPPILAFFTPPFPPLQVGKNEAPLYFPP